MRKRERITAVLLGISLALTGCGGTVTTEGAAVADSGQNVQTVEKNCKEAVYIGDASIEEYRIVGKNKECRAAGAELQMYIKRTVGVELPVETHAGFSGKTIMEDRKLRTYGYVRVSTKEQNENRQIDAMEAYGLNEQDLFIDRRNRSRTAGQ